MINKLIKDYIINQNVRFKDGSSAKIIDYAGTVLCHNVKENFEIQLYKVLYNNEEYYASNFGLKDGYIDIFKRVINGIGYRGKINFYSFKKEYKMWKDMIYRCYNPNNNLYQYYGALGVTVHPRWHCFEFFLYDIVTIDGYENFINPIDKKYYELDIYSKQSRIPNSNKYYGPGVVSLKLFYSSDVGINVKKIKQQSLNQPKQFLPLNNGDYSINDYKYAINNAPVFKDPKDDYLFTDKVYRTIHGISYRGSPITNPYSGPKKIMC